MPSRCLLHSALEPDFLIIAFLSCPFFHLTCVTGEEKRGYGVHGFRDQGSSVRAARFVLRERLRTSSFQGPDEAWHPRSFGGLLCRTGVHGHTYMCLIRIAWPYCGYWPPLRVHGRVIDSFMLTMFLGQIDDDVRYEIPPDLGYGGQGAH